MINFRPIIFFLGLVLSKLALFMYAPALLAFVTGTEGFIDFGYAIILTHLFSFVCLTVGRKKNFSLNARDMFLITTFVWAISSIFASLPFVFISHISFTDAYFETMSGITTTGSTVLSHIEELPPSILLWRSTLQWLGGVGFIVMAVAILPILNVGGMKLFHTESSDWSEKSSPRTKSIAKNIILVYLLLTILCIFGYLFTGMNLFDAINLAFTTISTGGYATSDASMNLFTNETQWVCILFMILGGLPFLLLVQSIRNRSLSTLFKDAQVKGFFILIISSTLLITSWLYFNQNVDFISATRVSLFNIVSIVTTTGYGLDDFTSWGTFPVIIFAFILSVGACSGSTSGGIKIFRFQVALSLLKKQFLQLIHPSAIIVQKYNQRPVTEEIVRSVVAFAITFLFTVIIIAAILGFIGLDGTTSISAAITSVANVGPGLGNLIGPSGNFEALPNTAKWVLSIGMLMGRLEILTVLVIFIPAFWKS